MISPSLIPEVEPRPTDAPWISTSSRLSVLARAAALSSPGWRIRISSKGSSSAEDWRPLRRVLGVGTHSCTRKIPVKGQVPLIVRPGRDHPYLHSSARKTHPGSPASEAASSPPSPEPSGQLHSLGGRNRDLEIRIPLEIHHQVSLTDKSPHGEVHLDAYRHGRIPAHPQSGVLDTDPSNLRANLDFHPLGDARLIGDDLRLSQEARCG